MKIVLAALALVVCCTFCHAQTKKLDSILDEINRYKKMDTFRVQMIMDYVSEAVNENTSRLLPFVEEVITISKAQHFKRGVESGYMTAQIYYSDRGDFANGMRYADSSFLVLEGDTSAVALKKLAYLHYNVGGDYYKMGDYETAILHFTEAAEILAKYDPKTLSSVYSGMAEVYEHMLLPQKAIEYDEKSIATAEKYGDKSAIVKRQLNYVVRMINQDKYDSAESRLKRIEPMVAEVNSSFSWFLFYQNKGYLLQHQKKFDGAIASYTRAKEYADASDDKYQYLTILDPLARSLMEAGRMNEAKTYLDTLLIKGAEYQMKFGRLNAYSGLAEWYGKKGEYKIANEYLVRKLALSDSITSEETKDKIAMMETRFRVAAKDNEIKALQDEKKIHLLTIRQKNTINYILIGGAAALIVILLLFYRKSQTEKQLAATEAVLKGEEQERARVAKDLHDGLGGMLSGIKHSFSNMKENLIMTPENAQSFERGIQMLDSSIKEMRRVAHNMMPEMLMQYGLNSALKELCIELGRSSRIQASYQPIDMDTVNFSQELSVAAYRVVQELANNAVKHADASTLLVQAHASVEDSLLQLTVEDNGKGVDIRDLDKSQGMGWKSIRNRVELLKGKIDISSLPGKGVSVIIEIPLS